MKPIYLEWSAFGPFANKVVLEIGKMVSAAYARGS